MTSLSRNYYDDYNLVESDCPIKRNNKIRSYDTCSYKESICKHHKGMNDIGTCMHTEGSPFE